MANGNAGGAIGPEKVHSDSTLEAEFGPGGLACRNPWTKNTILAFRQSYLL